jgi:hypothetical protein
MDCDCFRDLLQPVVDLLLRFHPRTEHSSAFSIPQAFAWLTFALLVTLLDGVRLKHDDYDMTYDVGTYVLVSMINAWHPPSPCPISL